MDQLEKYWAPKSKDLNSISDTPEKKLGMEMHILIPMWGRLRREDSYGLLTSLSLNKVTIVLVSKVRQINGWDSTLKCLGY